MNKNLKLIFIAFLISAHPAYGQLDELSMLGALNESISGTSGNVNNIEESEAREIDESNDSPQNRMQYKAYDYGYTGGENFDNAPQKKFPEKPLEYFGYDYFSSKTSPFIRLMNVPVPPSYLIGPNDTIKLILYGNKNKKYELIVNRDGEIFIPELGPLSVAGLTFNNLRKLISTTVASQLIGTEASVSLGELRTIDIFIVGAANKPGMYSLSALSSITEALFESGGISTSGSLRDIKLKRNGQTVIEFDLYDFLINGDTSNDKRLMQGDVILIEPIIKTAGVRGEANRPGIYELKEKENLRDLLRFAGKLKPKANRSNSEILRVNQSKNSFELLNVNLSSEKALNTKINNGDILSIFPVNNKIQNAVLVSGHTPQPGFYSLRENMRIADLFGSTEDLLEMTDLNYLLVKRKDKTTQKYSFIQIDLQQVLNDLNGEKNIILNDQDEILVFPSLLSTSSITTRLIQDKYIIDDETNKPMLEDEWNSLTYLRKSLMEDILEIEEQKSILDPSLREELDSTDIRRYYEYSIYDYCTIPEDLAILVVEESGFRANKSVPIEDLEGLKTPQDFITLQQSLEQERIKNQNQSEIKDIAMTITKICRDQLLSPLIDIVKRDNFTEKLSMISVYGSVHFPGDYPFTDNMSLADAIRAAGGPKNGTYDSEIEITTYNNAGKRFTSSNNFSSMADAESLDLKKMDTINLKQLSNDIKTVEITGEVFFPGIYPISENQTLSELINRAGGFTDYASPGSTYYQRESLKEAEIQRFESAQSELRRKILLSSQAGGLGQESLSGNAISQLTELISSDISQTDAMGRLVVDIEGILSGDSVDIILEDGDAINIPKNNQSISVIGEVFVSNAHIFKDNLTIDDYVGLSGGVTTFADSSSIYIIKSDGSILSPSQISSGFFRASSSIIGPGDTIVVPLQVQPFSTIRATTEITQIIYQMALAAAAVNSF